MVKNVAEKLSHIFCAYASYTQKNSENIDERAKNLKKKGELMEDYPKLQAESMPLCAWQSKKKFI